MIFVKLKASTNESENKMTRYQDDFYDAINGEWQKTAESQQISLKREVLLDLDQEIEDFDAGDNRQVVGRRRGA